MAILHDRPINMGMLIARNIKFMVDVPQRTKGTFVLLTNFAGWQESRCAKKM